VRATKGIMIPANLDFSISARGKWAGNSVAAFLRIFFEGIPVKSIFGFTEYTPLYGGRVFSGPELSPADIDWMYAHGIGYRIPLQNIVATREDYEQSKPFLEKYHRQGNSVITVRAELANWIKADFPLYEREASVINQVRAIDQIPEFFENFDVVVLHPELNDRPDELAKIEEKHRIRLFVNAGCMYKCPTMECYGSISRLNKRVPNAQFQCAQYRNTDYAQQRVAELGLTEFDPTTYIRLGFTRFKRMRNKSNTAF
jgi:hypothetical protein